MFKVILIVALLLMFVVGTIYCFFPVIRVCGDSMSPTYHDGEILFTKRILNKYSVKRGDVIVYLMHENGERNVIKRVVDIKQVDDVLSFYCVGDNSKESYDSRYYGYIPSAWLVCKPFDQRRCLK